MRFSLRTLIIVMLLGGPLCAWGWREWAKWAAYQEQLRLIRLTPARPPPPPAATSAAVSARAQFAIAQRLSAMQERMAALQEERAQRLAALREERRPAEKVDPSWLVIYPGRNNLPCPDW